MVWNASERLCKVMTKKEIIGNNNMEANDDLSKSNFSVMVEMKIK